MPTWSTDRKIKAAFFDADGTMLSFTTHAMPASTRHALRELRDAGVKCFLATGRAPYQVDDIPIGDLEAFILFNGQFILNRYAVLYQEPVDRDDVATVVQQVHDGLYQAIFMEKDRSYLSGYNERVHSALDMAGISIPVDDIDQALDHDVYQMNIFLGPGETGVVRDATKHLKLTRWSPNFVDAFPISGGKARAVRRVLEMYDLRPEEAMCFGDGGNDLGMFDAVGTSIAMGNGNSEVKEMADFVTDGVDENGIWNACVRLGLIHGDLL